MINRNLMIPFYDQRIHSNRKNIFQNDHVMASVDGAVLEKIRQSIKETNETIKIVSALPGYEHQAAIVDDARNMVDKSIFSSLKANSVNVTENLILRLFVNAMKLQQAGNCYEFSLYCHSLLLKKGIKSEVTRIKNGNHVFLIIDRDQSIPIEEVERWRQAGHAIIVDPFLNKIYMASEIFHYLQNCWHDEVLNQVKYIPFNLAEHTLSNDVLKEYVEDWRNALSQITKEESNRTSRFE